MVVVVVVMVMVMVMVMLINLTKLCKRCEKGGRISSDIFQREAKPSQDTRRYPLSAPNLAF